MNLTPEDIATLNEILALTKAYVDDPTPSEQERFAQLFPELVGPRPAPPEEP